MTNSTKQAAALILSVLSCCSLAQAADDPQGNRVAHQQELKPLAGLVGSWRGVGQVQRASQKGSWKEQAAWVWKLTAGSATLVLQQNEGRFLKSAVVRSGSKPGEFVLDATLVDGSSRSFLGSFNDRKQLVLTASSGDGLRRISLTPLHDTRYLMLLEAQDGQRSFRRLGEVGYTREGITFAAGDSAPICIVTGGRGTIPIKYKAETYYVCCSGCKELFDENPEAILAQAQKKQDAAKKK